MSSLSALMFFALITGAIIIVFLLAVAAIVGVSLFIYNEIKKKPKYVYTQAVDTQPDNTQTPPNEGQNNNS